MSSDYKILCVSHDPAIVIESDAWHSSTGGRQRVIEIAADPVGRDETSVHATCDLLVGRYSYPLIEVACPPSLRQNVNYRHSYSHPHEGRWVDAAWLRLLYHAYACNDPAVLDAAGRAGYSCWTALRINRLRIELGLTP